MKIVEIDHSVKEKVDANNGYCPCIIVQSRDSICMCKEFRDKITSLKTGESHTCRCGRYRAINEHI